MHPLNSDLDSSSSLGSDCIEVTSEDDSDSVSEFSSESFDAGEVSGGGSVGEDLGEIPEIRDDELDSSSLRQTDILKLRHTIDLIYFH